MVSVGGAQRTDLRVEEEEERERRKEEEEVGPATDFLLSLSARLK